MHVTLVSNRAQSLTGIILPTYKLALVYYANETEHEKVSICILYN